MRMEARYSRNHTIQCKQPLVVLTIYLFTIMHEEGGEKAQQKSKYT